MIQKICHQQWIKEVDAKKEDYAIKWVLSVTNDLQQK